MTTFKLLQDLENTQPRIEKVEETVTPKLTEYLIYVMTAEDGQKKIGVPMDMVESFDAFLASNENIELVIGNLEKFNAIEID